jgi:hypothetical protein
MIDNNASWSRRWLIVFMRLTSIDPFDWEFIGKVVRLSGRHHEQ